MFFQPPEIEPSDIGITCKSSSSLKSARRKRKKRAQKYKHKKQLLKIEKQRFANTMSSWAENFTMAATWQLKHQVAHWKSKASALEYENKILRDMLRRRYVNGEVARSNENTEVAEAMSVKSDTEEETDENVEEEDDTFKDEEDVEISEEFIEFLKSNAEFRKMREERMKLRQLEEEEPMRKLEACPEGPTDRTAEYQRLYGCNWQRIAALEMSMESKYMIEFDKEKPLYWPNMPLRMGYDNRE